MKQDDSISVVIPCFKQAHYVGDAIESVLAQTRRADEIIVVDDGSPDQTRQVCLSYPQLRYHYQTNQGLARARNAGMGLAQGRYIVFLDADDRLLPHALEQLFAGFQAHPEAGFVYGRYQIIDENGQNLNIETHPIKQDHFYYHLLQRNYIGCPATVMYRRELIQKLGAFDPSVNAAADYDLYLRIARQQEVRCVNTCVAEYRRHGQNMSSNSIRQLKQVLTALNRQTLHVADHAELKRAWRQGRSHYRTYYGGQLYWGAVEAAKAGKIRKALSDFTTLGMIAPEVLVAMIASYLTRVPGKLRRVTR